MAVIDGKWLSKEGLTYFWSKIKAIFTKQTETNVIANLGAKNLLLVTGTANTVNSVTYTVNEDGTITANGQASSNADWNVNSSFHLEPGTYKLTGCPTGGNNSSTYKLQIQGIGYDTGDGLTFTIASARNVNVYVRVWSGYNASNLVFKPMIRPASITDPSFQPYAPTNRELYETRFASKFILPNNVDLNNIKTGGIYNGVTSTGNSAVHMPVANGSFYFVLTVIELNESIIQIFKQLNSAGDPNLYIRRFFIYNTDWDSWYQFTGTQV